MIGWGLLSIIFGFQQGWLYSLYVLSVTTSPPEPRIGCTLYAYEEGRGKAAKLRIQANVLGVCVHTRQTSGRVS